MQPVNELLKFMETLGFAISFATCQLGNYKAYYLNVEEEFRAHLR